VVWSISRTGSTQTPTPFPLADRVCCGSQSNWSGVETARGTYVFTLVDNFISNIASHPGTFLIWTDRAVPSWASGGATTIPPTDLAVSAACQGVLTGTTTTDCMYKEYNTKFMQHVCGVSSQPVTPLVGACSIRVFEVWNEMNVGGYWTSNVANLARMAEDKAAIIRAYCGDCTILGGSVSAGGDGTGGSWINGSVGLEPFLAAWGALGSGPSTAITTTLSSNANSSGIAVTPARKQLTNCATGYSGGSLQPTGVPVGQLYCTTAAQTAGQGAGGPTQGVVSATSSGTGIAAVDNGQNAGGNDSPATVTDTYGATTDDAVCTTDPYNTLPTPVVGLSPAPCVSSSSAVFGESTASSNFNADSLFPTAYVSNSTTLDGALYYYRDTYFEIPTLTSSLNLEMDVNINSSPTAYGASTGAYFGWGFQYNNSTHTFQYCPQDCASWKNLTGIDVTGLNANLTTYTLTAGHWYHLRTYGHRLAGCTFTSGSNCLFYDYMTFYDVTAGGTPITYGLVDTLTGGAAGGIPVNHSTWTSGPIIQVQIDLNVASTSATAHIVSDTTVFYSGGTAHFPDAISWHAYPSRTTIKPAPFPETLTAHGSGTCTGTSNTSCRTAIKDQVATLYSSSIMCNAAITAWACNLPTWQTEGLYGLNSSMTDGIDDTDADTWLLRRAYVSRWMIAQSAKPASGVPPVQSMYYSWQDQCWGTANGTNAVDGNCNPPDSNIPSGVTDSQVSFAQTKTWLDNTKYVGPLSSTAVAGGNIWTVPIIYKGYPAQLAWFDGWLASTSFATPFSRSQTLLNANSSVIGSITIDQQPVLLTRPNASTFTVF
jgi:hypothetical protein